jgi:multicomponent Na+:H+ antiporter subunit D
MAGAALLSIDPGVVAPALQAGSVGQLQPSGGALTAFPPAFVVLAAALLVPFLSRHVGHALGAGASATVAIWSYLVPAGTHVPVRLLGFEAVLFNADEASRLMGIIFGLIGAVAVLYSYASQADNTQTAYALSYVGVSLGTVFAGDWLTLLFFWELMAVTSTLLVWYHGGKAVRAGFRYAILHGIGGSLLMAAIIWHYVAVGSFLFGATAGIATGIPAVLAALGIGVNVGFVGLHAWLPDTYPRPHIAASVFLCVFTTKTGVYGMYRAFPQGDIAIAYMGGAMAVFGVVFALLQNDMRRLLSYHIQSQVGYMIAGVGIGTALASAGAFAHVYNHILYKSLLFMTVGVIIYRTGEENLKNLGGLRREMPLTAIVFGIAALSIAGFPGFNGFVSKGMVLTAAHDAHLDALWWLLIIGGVGTFMSFIKLGYYAFFHGESDLDVADANRGQSIAMVVVAGLCVLYGVYPDALFGILPGTGASEAHPFTVSHLTEGFALAAAGLVGFYVTKKPLSGIGRVPDIDAIYNPATFYGTRRLVRATTGVYAAVDRAVVELAADITDAVTNPNRTAARILRALPNGLTENRKRTDGGAPEVHLRAGIGASVLLLVLVLTIVLIVVL